ncbi:MAG: LysM peptidoglycan-binding domain-containing protein, partial [FCB group bacterium]
KSYGISKADLVSANDLVGYKTRLQAGTKLKIPIELKDYLESIKNNSGYDNGSSNNQNQEQKPTNHTVKKGETLFSIANFYNLSINELKTLNNLPDSSDNIQIGSVIKISKDTSSTDSIKKNNNELSPPQVIIKTHSVKNGETISTIADEYKVSSESILKLNELKDENIQPGQILKIPNTPEPNISSVTPIKEIAATSVLHKCKKGETLKSIASKYNVSEYDLKKWNKNILKNKKLSKGTLLKIYTNNIAESPVKSHSKESIKSSKSSKSYKIRKGDTLSSIANKYHVSISSLKKINKNISGEHIREGQTIKIK